MDGATFDVNIHRKDKPGAVIPTTDPQSTLEAFVNINLAKSILLTFPGNLLYGFDYIVRGKKADWGQAKIELDSSINKLIANVPKNPSKEDREKRKNLGTIKDLVGQVRFIQDSGHTDHFHVGYGPGFLGDEVSGRAIIRNKREDEAAAATRDALLDPINRQLFKQILGISST